MQDWQDVDAYHTSEAVSQAERPEGWLQRRPLLDRASDQHPILTQLMDEAMTRIILTADGAVMPLEKRTTGTKDPSAPTSSLAALVDEFDRRFLGCKTHRQRLEVIKQAQATANRLRYAPKSDIAARGSKEWRQLIANDPRPRRVIAADYRVSSKTITAIRKEFAVSDLRDG